MKLKNPYRLIFFIIFSLGIALLVGFNLNYAKLLIEKSILVYGYLAVFAFGFLVDFIVQPIGPEVPASLGLIFGLNFYYVFLFVLFGSYLGSVISFFIGRNFLDSDIKRICKSKKRKKYCKLFRKYGKFALLIASVSPVPYVLFCWLSGAFKIKFTDFIIFGLVPRTFRILFVMLLISFFF